MPKFSPKIGTQFIFLSALLVGLAVFVSDRVYYNNSEDILVEAELNSLEDEAQLLLNPIQEEILRLKDDLRLLYSSPAHLAILDDPNTDNVEALAERFRALLLTRPNYLQVRFIDGRGQELVRLDRKGTLSGSVITRPIEDQLQNKRDEQYFAEAVNTKPGEVYLSNIDTNREFGKIIRPLVHVLRAAVPSYRKDESLAGMLIINLNMTRLLRKLSENVTEPQELYVTNTFGDYLWHPRRERLLDAGPQSATIQDEFPGSQRVVEGNRVKLLGETEGGLILSYLALPFDTLNPERRLGIGLTAQKESLLVDIRDLRQQNLSMSFALVALAALVAWVFSRLITRPLATVVDLSEKFPESTDTSALPVHKGDEIGVLARSFSRLVSKASEQEWLRLGQLEVADAIRRSETKQITAFAVLKCLCRHMDVALGAFYEVLPGGELRLLDGYAVKGESQAKKWIDSGGSLLTEALEVGDVQTFTDIPGDYYRIHSGLGEMRPNTILFLPILIDDERLGIIELARTRPFTDLQIEFARSVVSVIGLALIALRAIEKQADLLSTSQKQQEELQVTNATLEEKSRELEESQDVLKAQAAELEQTNAEMQSQNDEMEVQNSVLAEQKDQIEQQRDEIRRRMSETERVSKYKSEFLASMSHELRTPLNSMLILAKSFQDNDEGNLTEAQVEEASVIYNGGLELLHLINDVLDLAKIEAGKMSIVHGELSLRSMIQKLVRQFEPLCREKELRLEAHIDSDVPETIVTDSQRLEQVLKNLLSNAVKFTEAGSINVKLNCTGDGEVTFAVTDTGIGIDEDKAKDIFEAFQQEDGSIDRKYGGTGLGLSISQELATLLNGRISLVSKKGVGSTFTLTVPSLNKGPEEKTGESIETGGALVAAEPAPRISVNATGGDKPRQSDLKTLLVVEDDQDFARTLAGIAERQGYETYVTGSGTQALLMAHAHKPSAIVLDLVLSDLDGMQVLEQLKRDIRTRHIPVHVISARDDGKADTLRQGAVGYLTKPVTPEQVNAVLADAANIQQSIIKRVLVVEDDRNTQIAISNLLKNGSVEICQAETGADGLERLDEGSFDCIILDLQLPDMTGFDWLSQIEAMDEGIIPPIVIYTARQLTREETRRLEEYTGSIIIKGAHSPERLLDEVMLFLHSLDSSLSDLQRKMIEMQNDPNDVFESRKILLVDDDMRNVFAVSKLLKKQGVQVVIADNGQMALDQLEKESDIALVIMDIMMPVMDGYEAIQKIRANPVYKDLPIIALTARSMPDEREKCLAAGANDYVAKPLDMDMLLTLMRVLLVGERDVA